MSERMMARSIAIAILGSGALFVAFNWAGLSAVSPAGGVWDRVFASDEVVLATRLGLVAASLYLIGSFVALVVEGRWLSRAGPAGAEADPAEVLYRADARTVEEVEHLRRRFDRLEGVVRELDIDMEEAFAIIDPEDTDEGAVE